MSENELIEKCKQGEKAAFEKLYKTYAPHMKGLCLRYIADEMLAEDVLHDGFIKVIGSIRTFQYRGEGSLKAWMSRIFYNESISAIRKNQLLSESSVDYMEVADEIEDVSSLSIIPESVLMDFVTALNVNYRTVFNLFVFEDMSHKEIGQELGIAEEASRARLSRAKAILVKKVKTYLATNG